MDILAASYTNIGPFFDRTISLIFRSGNYVINAPVGTGKSFLFFDGPIFSLYKHAPRPIRNRRSKTGVTELIFSCNDELWLVVRSLGGTKMGGDSVKTKLYKYQKLSDDLASILAEYEMFSDVSWLTILKHDLEEIVCTSEKEVERLLQDLLPPKEVVLSANFLMQDAINVFELAPAQRLNIFKHIFGFIGIDHAKETLRDKRKEVQTRITVMKDISHINEGFSKRIRHIQDTVKGLQSYTIEDSVLDQLLQSLLATPTLKDIVLLNADIHVGGFSCDIDKGLLLQILAHIQKKHTQRNTMKGKQLQLQETVTDVQKECELLDQENKDMLRTLAGLKKKMGSTDTQQLKILEKKAQELVEQQKTYTYTSYATILEKHGYTIDSFVDCVRVIDELRAQGRESKTSMQRYTEKYELVEQQEKEMQERKKNLQKNIDDLQTKHEQHMSFQCDKISAPCPYVDAIKGSSSKVLAQQKERMEKEYASLDIQTYAIQKKELLRDQQEQEKKYNTYLLILQEIGWKQCMEEFAAWQEVTDHLQEVNKQIQALMHGLLERKEQEKMYTDLQVKQGMVQQQYEKKMNLYTEMQKKYDGEKKDMSGFDEKIMMQVQQYIQDMQQDIHDLQGYIDQWKQREYEVQKLEEEQLRLKHVYNLFSKELLLLVLQDFLPNIESMMNTYLDDVADYTVSFSVDDSESDAISLDIFAQDQRGTRPVKSLSGGQKSLLKLAWILSIASLMKLPFLFLDETITSLDATTTSDVADVLHRFVQTYTIKFYVVTHAPQIQEMSIWDKEILLPV